MNRFAVSPVPASDIPGSDYAGQWCTFEWEENFPYTGEYTFRGMVLIISVRCILIMNLSWNRGTLRVILYQKIQRM